MVKVTKRIKTDLLIKEFLLMTIIKQTLHHVLVQDIHGMQVRMQEIQQYMVKGLLYYGH
jgi:hypothetical protein